MAEFARHPKMAVKHPASDNDATANAGPESQQHQVVDAAARSHPFFAESSRIGVVFQDDLDSQKPLDLVAHPVVVEVGQIGRANDQALVHEDEAGNADADAGELARAETGAERFDGLDNAPKQGLAAGAFRSAPRNLVEHL